MWETVVVALIVLVAGVAVGRGVLRRWRSGGACGGSCPGACPGCPTGRPKGRDAAE